MYRRFKHIVWGVTVCLVACWCAWGESNPDIGEAISDALDEYAQKRPGVYWGKVQVEGYEGEKGNELEGYLEMSIPSRNSSLYLPKDARNLRAVVSDLGVLIGFDHEGMVVSAWIDPTDRWPVDHWAEGLEELSLKTISKHLDDEKAKTAMEKELQKLKSDGFELSELWSASMETLEEGGDSGATARTAWLLLLRSRASPISGSQLRRIGMGEEGTIYLWPLSSGRSVAYMMVQKKGTIGVWGHVRSRNGHDKKDVEAKIITLLIGRDAAIKKVKKQ
jgi:hypothetical protein